MPYQISGPELWEKFLSAHIADERLYDLAKDLYFMRPQVTGGRSAIDVLSGALGQHPLIVYSALNTDPGKPTLDELGVDYEQRKAWTAVGPKTKFYVERSAIRLSSLAAKVEAARAKQPSA